MDINVQELKNRLDNNEKFILIDVREPYEFEEFNLGGELIPLASIPAALEKYTDRKDEEIVLYCRSGGRSGQAQRYMQSQGFKNVRNLLGGVLAWKKEYGDNRP